MRQRKIKNLDEKIRAHKAFLIEEPETMKGKWASAVNADGPIYIEIGCGKGQFITETAVLHPDWNLIAFEGHESVVLHALEKATQKELGNVHFVIKYVKSLKEIFDHGELDGIFLNFSDPWPKARHEKRRLTCAGRLTEYADIVKKEGFIEFKTDNDGLFDYTLEQVNDLEFLEIVEITRDLHGEYLQGSYVTTEYEDKFASAGKKINYIKIKNL